MSGPTKHYDENKIGQHVQINYKFIEKLFNKRGQKAFRDKLFSCADEAALRRALKRLRIDVPNSVRIILVDIQYARMKSYPPHINPTKDSFYMLVMPPVPTNKKTADPKRTDYTEMQAWESAWLHAIVDGYGM